MKYPKRRKEVIDALTRSIKVLKEVEKRNE